MNTIRRNGGRWSFEKKKRRIGYAFIASWLIGFFLLYAKPLVESLVYTFHTLKVTSSGFEMNPAGLDNYRYAFSSDPDFLRILLTSLKDILYQTPTILVFSLLIYSLTISFGDVGKAVVVVVMVLQIAGSSGTFPIELLPDVYQKIYHIFPFPYAIDAMRECICGLYGLTWLKNIGCLLIFGAAALLIGLWVRKPFMGLNHFMEEKLEETEML